MRAFEHSFITVNSTYHQGNYLFPIAAGEPLVFSFVSKVTAGQSSVCPIAESTPELLAHDFKWRGFAFIIYYI